MDGETERFIDLWEENRMLWDVWSPQYRNTAAKASAYAVIAQAMGERWNSDMVRRKIESLLTYFRYHKKRLEGGPGRGAGVRKPWVHYTRLQRFLASKTFSQTASTSSLSLPVSEDVVKEEEHPREFSAGDVGSPSQHLQHTMTENRLDSPSDLSLMHPPSSQCLTAQQRKRSLTDRAPDHGTQKRGRNLDIGDDQLSNAATQLTAILAKNLSEPSDKNPNRSFGMYVADRLDKIKNEKTLITLRKQINHLIDDTLLEEL